MLLYMDDTLLYLLLEKQLAAGISALALCLDAIADCLRAG